MAAPVVPNGIVPEVLKYYNFEDWSIRVKTYLSGKDLWEVVEGTETEQENVDEAKSKAWRKKNAKALHVIQFCCGDDAFSCISGRGNAKDAWQALEEEFRRPGIIKIIDERPVDSDVAPDDELEDMKIEGSKEEVAPEILYRYYLKRASGSRADLDLAMDLVRKYPNLIRARSELTGETILHMAVIHLEVSIVKELVKLMKAKDLEIRDAKGFTALARAVAALARLAVPVSKAKNLEIRDANDFKAPALPVAVHGAIAVHGAVAAYNDIQIKEKAKKAYNDIIMIMVEYNKNLLSMWMPPQNRIPVGYACNLSKWELADYLYHRTPEGALNSVHGAEMITQYFRTLKFDKALELIGKRPNLVITKDNNGGTPLAQLAGMSCAFLRGSQLKFWEKWIYNGMRITVSSEDSPPIDYQWCCIFPAVLFRPFASHLHRILGISRIYKMKLTHTRFNEILNCMCNVIMGNMCDNQLRIRFVQEAMFRAIERGHVEFIRVICGRNKELFHIGDLNQKSMFQFAVECRQDEIYNLIYELDNPIRTIVTTRVDKFYNNMLHAAGRVSPFAQLDNVQGAALQMQRELQWFKEVKKIIPFHMVETKNFKERMSAHELFTENHKELVKAGEIAMKDTATSCTVVGALIVTIMFAAAFTVPGGNNGNTGAPMFINKKSFMVFIASDAISLFSSTTSVMIFLGIFTSRYAEDDFLKSLPKKMIFGLLTLFLSVTSMMIAFASALFIMLDEPWIVGLVSFLASVPILTFVWMQTPLFVATLKSTYGRGIFNNKLNYRN